MLMDCLAGVIGTAEVLHRRFYPEPESFHPLLGCARDRVVGDTDRLPSIYCARGSSRMTKCTGEKISIARLMRSRPWSSSFFSRSMAGLIQSHFSFPGSFPSSMFVTTAF